MDILILIFSFDFNTWIQMTPNPTDYEREPFLRNPMYPILIFI